MQYSQEHLKTMVYAKFGGQTDCIMGNSKIENSITDSSHPGFQSIRTFLRLILLQLHNGRPLARVPLVCVFWAELFKAGFTQGYAKFETRYATHIKRIQFLLIKCSKI